MTPIITPYSIAQNLMGIAEMPGALNNPAIVAMLQFVDKSVSTDEVPWCSAFVNAVCKICGLPRSGSLAARSWLQVGRVVTIDAAAPGWDVVILKRGAGKQPGPEVTRAPGHVGFFAGLDTSAGGERLHVLGGNQGNRVSLASFPAAQLLGIRRLIV